MARGRRVIGPCGFVQGVIDALQFLMQGSVKRRAQRQFDVRIGGQHVQNRAHGRRTAPHLFQKIVKDVIVLGMGL